MAITKRLDAERGIHAIELNVSCPNVKEGGIEFGKDAGLSAEVTAAVRAATARPVWVKMSPEAGDLVGVARACERAGADALTAINTIRGMAIDPATMRVRLANRTGGLSGPAIRPIALRIVWDLVGAVDIPVIGIGGISPPTMRFSSCSPEPARCRSALSFSDPGAAKRILDGIAAYAAARDPSVAELIGRAR